MTYIQAVFYGNPDWYPPILNGMRLLCDHGFTVEVLCPDNGELPKASLPPTCQIKRIGKKSGSSWRDYLAFVWDVMARTDHGTDLFWGHDMHGLLPARMMATMRRKPLVYQSHELVVSNENLGSGGRLVFAFQRRFARTADLIVTPDRQRAAVMQVKLGLTDPPLVAANAPLSRPANDDGRLRRAVAAQNPEIEQIVLRQGNIGPGHAVEATIKSMPYWRSKGWGLVLLGPIKADYVDHLRRRAQEMGALSRLLFLPPVPYGEVMGFTIGADVGHALYEAVDDNNRLSGTASNKLLEYMASALPLLVSDRPGLRALVERHDCGLTADESDPASIAAAVNVLLGDPARARQMGANAARAFEEEFRFDRQFAPVLAALEELVHCNGDRR